MTPVSGGKVKKLTADVDAEADGLKESDPTAGKRIGNVLHPEGKKAQRLKRVFNGAAQVGPRRYGSENLQCLWAPGLGGPMKIVASIEDPFVIGKILSHLEAMCGSQGSENRRLGVRAPPPSVW